MGATLGGGINKYTHTHTSGKYVVCLVSIPLLVAVSLRYRWLMCFRVCVTFSFAVLNIIIVVVLLFWLRFLLLVLIFV